MFSILLRRPAPTAFSALLGRNVVWLQPRTTCLVHLHIFSKNTVCPEDGLMDIYALCNIISSWDRTEIFQQRQKPVLNRRAVDCSSGKMPELRVVGLTVNTLVLAVTKSASSSNAGTVRLSLLLSLKVRVCETRLVSLFFGAANSPHSSVKLKRAVNWGETALPLSVSFKPWNTERGWNKLKFMSSAPEFGFFFQGFSLHLRRSLQTWISKGPVYICMSRQVVGVQSSAAATPRLRHQISQVYKRFPAFSVTSWQSNREQLLFSERNPSSATQAPAWMCGCITVWIVCRIDPQTTPTVTVKPGLRSFQSLRNLSKDSQGVSGKWIFFMVSILITVFF